MKCTCIWTLILVLTVSYTYAQKRDGALSQLNIELFTSRDGLPTNGALRLAQTPDGYLWIGTFDGLCRFDGVKIEDFAKSEAKLKNINTFWTLFVDEDSTLWMGTHGGGLVAYHDDEIAFLKEEQGVPSNIVEAVYRDSKGTLWIGSPGGLAYFKNGKFTNDYIPDVLKEVTIFQIREDRAGRLWIATNGRGLIRFDGNNFIQFSTENGFFNDIINDVLIDSKNKVWAATNEKLVCIENEKIKQYLGIENGLPDNSVMKLFESSNGNIWIGTKSGLSRIKNGRLENLNKRDVIGEHRVTDIIEDKEGNIWVSTYRSGFYSLKSGKFLVYGEEEGLISDLVHGITPIDQENYYIVTDEGINIFNVNGTITGYKNNNKMPTSKARDLLVDSKNQLWVATKDGLFFDDQKGNTKVYTTEDGLSNNYIRLAFEDSRGNLWVGTPDGLNLLTEHGFRSFGRDDGLSNEFILSLFEDSKRRLWIGTRDGLTLYEKNIFKAFSTKDGLAGPVTFQIHEDEDGAIWVGANGGLARYKNGKFFPFTSEQGLSNNTAFAILEDDSGFFWIPSNEGIYSVSRNELNLVAEGQLPVSISKIYNRNDGLRINDCTANARPAITPDGKFLIPTIKGFVIIDPYNIPVNNIPPTVVIKKILVDGEQVEFKNKLELEPSAQRINIHFAGLSFQAPSRVQYEYKLVGFDKSSVIARNNRDVSYTNLEPGTYRFEVTASNNDGVWNRKGKSLVIIKKAYFYETAWFRIVSVVFILVAIYIFYLWRIRLVAEQNRTLEALVKERTLELELRNEKIKAQQKDIEEANEQLLAKNDRLIHLNDEKNHLIKIVAHDLKSPLKQILGLTNLLSFSQDNSSKENQDYLEKIKGSIQRLDKMISNILDIETIESEKSKLDIKRNDIVPLVHEVVNSYKHLAGEKQITLHEEYLQKPLQANVDKTHFIQIIENLVSNAIKFSPKNKEIHVRAYEANETIVVEIADQGPGISQEDMKKMFGKYQQLSAKPTGGEISTGLGLSIVKKYIDLMNGKVYCKSTVGKGASFYVEFASATELSV